MDFYKSVLGRIERNRNRRLEGKINCIPWGFPRLENYSPGLEKSHYYLVTAGAKEAKSQITDHMFLYQPFEYIRKNPDCGFKVNGIYFTLEMSKEVKVMQAICRKLFLDSSKRNRKELKILDSKVNNKEGILDEETLAILNSDEYLEYFKDFLDTWTFVSDVKHSYGIKKFVEDYLNDKGTWTYQKVDYRDKPIRHKWIPNDPDEILIIVVDHLSLLTPSAEESRSGRGLYNAISNLSKYFIELRDNYGITAVAVQQQSLEKENNKSHELGRLRPSPDGLSDYKGTIKDINTAFGIFSPHKRNLTYYPDKSGYYIPNFQDHIRFLEIIAGREGGVNNMIPLFFDGAVNWFQEMPKLNDSRGLDAIQKYLARNKLLD